MASIRKPDILETEGKILYLIRHGETRSNREGIFRGRLEIPLAEAGRQQARELGEAFSQMDISAATSSPRVRAMETAGIAFPDLEVKSDETLDNLDLGEWSGRRKIDIRHEFPGEWERWTRDPHGIRFPGGESLAHVHARAQHFLEWFRDKGESPLAAVTHRSVIKCLLGAALGMETNYFWKFHLDNGSVTRLVWETGRGFTLVTMNDTRHLSSLVAEWY